MYDYIRIFFSVVIANSAVPIFFIISGYLLFFKVEKYDRTTYISKIRKRYYSLVVPYFSWIVLIIIWNLIYKFGCILLRGNSWTIILDYFRDNNYLHMLWNSSVWGERTTWLGIHTYNSGPALLPFWYMRDLILMVLFSPIIYWLIKRIKIVFIILLIAIYTLDVKVSWISGTIVYASLFFSLGAYFAIKKQDFTDVLWRRKKLICLLAVILMALQTYMGASMGNHVSCMIHPWMAILQSFAIIILASTMCKYRYLYDVNKNLAKTSFFIYAFHVFILGYLTSLFNKLYNLSSVFVPSCYAWIILTFKYFALPLVCVVICILVYHFLRKYLPVF